MQTRVETPAPAAYGAQFSPSPSLVSWDGLWRGAWVIFHKHMRKFRHNSMEIGGTLGFPLLFVATLLL